MKDTFYFSHDYNARQDDKIKRLVMKHGLLGYGIFWAIIENLYNNANALLLDCELIAYEMRTTENMIDSIINDFDLFVIDNGFFGSLSVERRLNEREEKSKKASKSAFLRWDRIKNNSNALQTECDGNAIKESKVKEIKEKKEKTKVFIPPTISEVINYFIENGYTELSASKAFNYYDCASWVDSKGNKIKNWKQKMQGVWFKDENASKSKNEQVFSKVKYIIDGETVTHNKKAYLENLEQYGEQRVKFIKYVE
mgnify:CR=1 FL=1